MMHCFAGILAMPITGFASKSGPKRKVDYFERGGNQGELQVEENSKLLGSRSKGDKANA